MPPLNLQWIEFQGLRSGYNIRFTFLRGPERENLTLIINSIKYRGVKLYNSPPNYIKSFHRKLEDFKIIPDEYLKLLPDQPEIGNLIIEGTPSKFIIDGGRWLEEEVIISMTEIKF